MSHPPPGSAAIITNRSHTKFLLQQKREDHGILQYRGAYSLFGGSIEDGETPEEGLKREFCEEILDQTIVDELVRQNTLWRTYRLKGIIYAEFVCHIFIAEIDDLVFEVWEKILEDTNIITEGKAVIVKKEKLLDLLKNPKLFVGSLDRVIKEWLTEQV